MFESELREEQKMLRELQYNVRRVISIYERNLQTIIKNFSKVDGAAEKEIEKLLKELDANINDMIKSFIKSADAKLKDYQKIIDEEEKKALEYFEDYKNRNAREFNSTLDSLIMFKGEL